MGDDTHALHIAALLRCVASPADLWLYRAELLAAITADTETTRELALDAVDALTPDEYALSSVDWLRGSALSVVVRAADAHAVGLDASYVLSDGLQALAAPVNDTQHERFTEAYERGTHANS